MSRFNFRALSVLTDVSVAYFLAHNLLLLVLHLLFKFRASFKPISKTKLQELIANLSPFGADYSTVAIYSYTINMVSVCVFYIHLGRILTTNPKFNPLYSSLALYVKDPEESRRSIRESLNVTIVKLIQSNLEFQNKIKAFVGGSKRHFEDSEAITIDWRQRSMSTSINCGPRLRSVQSTSVSHLKLPSADSFKSINTKSHVDNYLGVYLVKASVSEQIDMLDQQQRYLTSLMSDCRPVWPSNRLLYGDRDTVAAQWYTSFLLGYIFTYFNGWFVCEAAILYISQGRFKPDKDGSISLTGDRMSRAYRSLWILITSLLICKLAKCIVIIYLSALDEYHFLVSLRSEVQQFIMQVSKLGSQSIDLQASPSSYERMKTHYILQKLKFDYDCKAINIYIKYQYLIRQLGPLLRLTEYIISLLTVFLLFMYLFTSTLYEKAHPNEQYTMLVVMFGIMADVNLTALAFSTLSTSCIKLSRYFWSLLANSKCHELSLAGATGMQRLPEAASENSNRIASGCYFELSLISPHTLLLWRNLIFDEKRLESKLCCRIFGSLKIDFRSIFMFDVYLISAVMLYVTYKT